MKDFLETDMQIGFLSLASLCRLDRISVSRTYQGMSVILVKKGFFPSRRKKPIDGSIITSLIPASLAKLTLFFNALSVLAILPVAGALLYAPIITDTPAFAATSAIMLSYFSPVTSLIASAPAAIASFATAALGVSAEIGKLQALLTTLIASVTLLISSSIETMRVCT